MPTEPTPSPKKKPSLTSYGKYSAMGLQMAVIIALGVWFGRWLDHHFQTKFPAFTMALSLISVFGAVYWVVKDLLKKK